MGDFNPVDHHEIQETKPNSGVEHKVVSFAIIAALLTLVTNKANSHTFEVEIHTRQKLCHFGRYVAKAKLFRLKSCVPVTRAGVFI